MRRAHSRAAMSASLVEATVKQPIGQQAQVTAYCSVVFDVSRGGVNHGQEVADVLHVLVERQVRVGLILNP